MSGVSNYAATEMLNASLVVPGYTFPSALYLALYTVTPSASMAGTEVTGGAYARQGVTFAAASGTPITSVGPTASMTTFPTATASWDVLVAFGLLDASVGGNLWFFGPLTTPRTININDTIQFPENSLTVSLG